MDISTGLYIRSVSRPITSRCF